MSEHPTVRGYGNTCAQERSAEAFLKPLDLFGAESALDGVHKITIGGCSRREPSFDNTGGRY